MPGYFGTDEDRMWNPDMASAARSYDRYAGGQGGPTMGGTPGAGGSDWLSQLFGRMFGGQAGGQGRITSEPLPPPPGYSAQPMWTPPPAPQAPPATRLTSAPQIAQRISRMLAPPMEPPSVGSQDFTGGVPYDPYGMPAPPTSADFSGGIPYDPSSMAPPISAADFGPPRPAGRPRPAGLGGGWFGPRQPESIPIPQRRAMGGPIEMMRGGYPELYDQPIRSGYFATGGGSNYVEPDGYGDGRSDHVEARLSPGEYVMDAETVSLLGNGDNDAGARQLDAARKRIRMDKGKKLAEGKFSPDAKPAAEYLIGNPMGDGIRRMGKEK